MKKLTLAALSSLMFLNLAVIPAQAKTYYGYSNYRHDHPVRAYFNRHPYQKKSLIGAGIGAGGGLLLGGRGGLLKGAALGAAGGAGYEYFKKHF